MIDNPDTPQPLPTPRLGHPFAQTVVRSVLCCYAIYGAVLVADLATCLARNGDCSTQRQEIKGAATMIPAALLAWLADSPLTGSH